MLELRAIVYGRVHGVGFRAAVKRLADGLHLMGYVCNKSDGTVQICAQGDRKCLEQLLHSLEHQFGPQYIERIDSSYGSIKTVYASFAISA